LFDWKSASLVVNGIRRMIQHYTRHRSVTLYSLAMYGASRLAFTAYLGERLKPLPSYSWCLWSSCQVLACNSQSRHM